MSHDYIDPEDVRFWDSDELLARIHNELHSVTERGFQEDRPNNQLRLGAHNRLFPISVDLTNYDPFSIPADVDASETPDEKIEAPFSDYVSVALWSGGEDGTPHQPREFEAVINLLDESNDVVVPVGTAATTNVPGGIEPRMRDTLVDVSRTLVSDYVSIDLHDHSGAESNIVQGVVYIS